MRRFIVFSPDLYTFTFLHLTPIMYALAYSFSYSLFIYLFSIYLTSVLATTKQLEGVHRDHTCFFMHCICRVLRKMFEHSVNRPSV